MAIKTIVLPIIGMSCSSCSRAVEKQVEHVVGLISKSVDHDSDSGQFTIDESKLSESKLIETINKGHYKVDLPKDITTTIAKEMPACPTCNVAGVEVPNTVLRSNLKPDTYKKTVLEDNFNICMNPSCTTAYYTTQRNQVIDKSELKRELYFKNGTEIEIICYCNNVDRQQVEEVVNQHDITGWDEAMAHYRNKVQEKCEILNPTGLCCRNLFDEVVNEIKSIK